MIGLEPTFEAHLENLVAVFREIRRVLRKDGTVWLNYGDAYAANRGAQVPDSKHVNVGNSRGSKVPAGLKPKDLMFMPVRVALALQSDGWWVRSKIIWHKPNPMPESTTDRPTSAYEEMFLLSKSGDKLFWTHRAFPGVRVQPEPDYVWRNRDTAEETPIEPAEWRETPSQKDPEQKMWQRVNLWVGHDYFYDAEAVRVPHAREWTPATNNPGWLKGKSKLLTGASQVPGVQSGSQRPGGYKKGSAELGGANLRNVWQIATQSVSEAHFATFPERLVEPCILAGTSAEGACAKCGAPWTRATSVGYSKRRPNAVTGRASGGDSRWNGSPQLNKHVETTGWKPTCECEAPKVPCTVLDPFVGSGTTLRVATRLNRRGIGLDLAYQEIAKKRTSRVQRELPLG